MVASAGGASAYAGSAKLTSSTTVRVAVSGPVSGELSCLECESELS